MLPYLIYTLPPVLKPPCSSSIKPSFTLWTLVTKVPEYIFPTTLNKLNSQYLLHSAFSTLHLYSGTITVDFQSSGETLLSKAISHSLQILSTTTKSRIFYYISRDLILNCSLTFLKLPHSYVKLCSTIPLPPKQIPLRTPSQSHLWTATCSWVSIL